MAEKDYRDRIEETKAALEKYSEQAEALKKLYDQAIRNADAAYDEESRRLSEQRAKDRNEAATDALRTEKNLNQALASRGLSLSGENAQTKLDLTLGLQNRLADIDRSEREAQSELARDRAETRTKLETEQIRAGGENAERLAKLQAELAGLELDSAGGGGSGGGSGGGGSGSGTGGEEKKPAATDPIAVAQAFAEKVKESAKRAKDSLYLTPEISAASLAKQMVNTVSSFGHIYGSRQQLSMSILLDRMQLENRLEPSYYKQLMLNLESLGYTGQTEPDQPEEETGTTDVENEAKAAYEKAYKRYYNIYRAADYGQAESDRMATDKAKVEELRYLYESTGDSDSFRRYVADLGLADWLPSFYETLKE